MNQAQIGQLVSTLRVLLQRLDAGDPSALSTAQRLKASSKTDPRAQLAWNTLASMHWKRPRPGDTRKPQGGQSITWNRATAFYERLVRDDRAAWERFRQVQQSAKQGQEDAVKAFSLLKAIHNHRKRSADYPNGYPGAPRTGYYPMPTQHRPGIVIGANVWDPFGGGGVPAIPGLPGGLPAVPGFTPPQSPIPGLPGGIPGLPGGIPGLPGGIPGLSPPQPQPQIPGLPYIPGVPPIPGVTPPQPQPQQFLPLNPQVVSQLLGLITQARQSDGLERSVNPMMATAAPMPANFNMAPKPNILSTVAKPVVTTTALLGPSKASQLIAMSKGSDLFTSTLKAMGHAK